MRNKTPKGLQHTFLQGVTLLRWMENQWQWWWTGEEMDRMDGGGMDRGDDKE